MKLDQLDHVVLTVADIEQTCRFYSIVLGMDIVTFAARRKGLSFGTQKIDLHLHGHEFEPKADHPLPGSADLCFLTSVPIHDVIAHLDACGVTVVEGPVHRTGAPGMLLSVYFRDPDNNLIEVANHDPSL